MELSKAGPRVEQTAAAVADAACELVDTAASATWSTGAIEDATDAIDLLVGALAAIDPEAARILAAVPVATAELRKHLSPPTTDEDVATVPAPRSGRPRRRGLGPGWTGVRPTG
ncbi:hypothetical protein [Streptomyces jumonjinensis]|uniref:hypothetical protein n=1 Tax=Streptomyces jumonjinensis TaxID=1945 RepID=UPI0037A98823